MKRKTAFQKLKTILSVDYDAFSFRIYEDAKGKYIMGWRIGLDISNTGLGYVFEHEQFACSKNAVIETFNLLKRCDIINILDEVKQSEFRDIECFPPSPIVVQCDYESFQYVFNDSYGCNYKKSQELETQLCISKLMLNLFALFLQAKQGKL